MMACIQDGWRSFEVTRTCFLPTHMYICFVFILIYNGAHVPCGMEVCILYGNMFVQTPKDFKSSCNKVWIYNSSSFLFRFGKTLHNYAAPDSWLPVLLLWCFKVIWTTCHEAAAIDRFHRGMSSTEWLMHETFWWYLCKVKCSSLNSHWSEGHQDMVESQNLVL